MNLPITKVGDNEYTCVSYNQNGEVEWETDSPMTAEALAKELVNSLGYHQVDVYSEILNADPVRGETIRKRNIESVEKLLKDEEKRKSNPEISELLDEWLKNRVNIKE